MDVSGTIRTILSHKSGDVFSISPEATVFEAIEMMEAKNVGALLVMEREQVVGIISERDYARKVFLKGKSSKDTQVREIMSYPVICVPPELTVERTMTILTEKRIRHLPVVIGEKVVGVVSIGDVVRAMIDDRDFHIEQLTKYVTGSL